MTTPTVDDIVKEYLTIHRYGGLFHDIGCGCYLDDLAPCGELTAECRAAWKVPCLGGSCELSCEGGPSDFCLTTERPAE